MVTRRDDVRQAFVARVRRRMRVLDYTQGELAKRVGLSRPAVSSFLRPGSDLWWNGGTICLLPDALHCNGHWLLTGKGPESGAGTPSRGNYNEGYADAVRDMTEFLESLTPNTGSKP